MIILLLFLLLFLRSKLLFFLIFLFWWRDLEVAALTPIRCVLELHLLEIFKKT